jgi:colanic acid/amylovoran biosynthesis protein
MMAKSQVLASRVPLVLAPQTYGPFTRQPYRALAGWAIRKAALVVARDPTSRRVAQEISGREVGLATDVAVRLPYTPSAERGGFCAINASGLLWADAEASGTRFPLGYDYREATRNTIAALIARGERVCLFTHANSTVDPRDDDAAVTDLLAREFPAAERIADFAHPSQAKSFVSGAKLVVSARMHACIAAYSTGVPVVPLAYSRKFSGLLGETLGYGEVVDMATTSVEAVVAAVLSVLDRRDEVAAAIADGNTRVDALIEPYVAGLADVLGSIG